MTDFFPLFMCLDGFVSGYGEGGGTREVLQILLPRGVGGRVGAGTVVGTVVGAVVGG